MRKKIKQSLFYVLLILVLTICSNTAYASAKVSLSSKNMKLCYLQTKTITLRNVSSAVEWSISDADVVKIKPVGRNRAKCKITALKSGKAVIKARYGNKTYKCTVDVKYPVLDCNNLVLNTGEDADVTLQNVISKVNWEISDQTVARIDCSGKNNEVVTVTSLKSGNTVVKAKYAKKTYYIRIQVNNDPVTPHVHSWNKGMVLKEESCEEDGIILYTCSVCGRTKTESIPHLEHEWSCRIMVQKPTCDEIGYEAQYCLNCKQRITHSIPSLGHDFETEYSTDIYATCSKQGQESRHCKRCNAKTDITIIPKTEHTQDVVHTDDDFIKRNPTCKEEGIKVVKCCDCGVEYEVKIPITDHKYMEGVIEKKPTCTEDGRTTYHCETCDAMKEETVAHLGHLGKNGICIREGCGQYCAGLYDENGNMIINWEDLQKKYRINLENNTATMKSVMENYFNNYENITVYLDETDKVGNSKFKNCKNIKRVIVPDTVITIGESAFEGCENLSTIDFADDSLLENIGKNAFKGCKSLDNVTLPVSMRVLDALSFCQCNSLKNIALNDGLSKIREGVFKESAIADIQIPDSVTEIGKNAFQSCKNLENIKMSKHVKSISDGMFDNCISLKVVDFNDAELVSLGKEAFHECTSLQSIQLPDSIGIIQSEAFMNCQNLKSVNLPDSLMLIDKAVFRNCNGELKVMYHNSEYNQLEQLNEKLMDEGIATAVIY